MCKVMLVKLFQFNSFKTRFNKIYTNVFGCKVYRNIFLKYVRRCMLRACPSACVCDCMFCYSVTVHEKILTNIVIDNVSLFITVLRFDYLSECYDIF